MDVMEKGGPAMWPLLALSVISVTLTVERTMFWLRTHRPGRRRWVERAITRLRAGDAAGVRSLTADDATLYGAVGEHLLNSPPSPKTADVLIETHRGQIERFLAAQSTIYTAAPLLGILGTVLGIIRSFDLMGGAQKVTDIGTVAAGIAEALVSTASGLVVALITLFPYMYFRVQAERCMGAIERLADAARR